MFKLILIRRLLSSVMKFKFFVFAIILCVNISSICYASEFDETIKKKTIGAKIAGAEYYDEMWEKYRVIAVDEGSCSGGGGGNSSDQSFTENGGTSGNASGVIAFTLPKWTVVVDGDIVYSDNSLNDDINNKADSLIKDISDKNSNSSFIDCIKNIFGNKNKQKPSNIVKKNNSINVIMPNFPIKLTLNNGRQLEITNIESSFSENIGGRCSGTIYYKVRRLANNASSSGYRFKIKDSSGFVPEGYEIKPEFGNTNIGEIAEGRISYPSIPCNDSYRLIIEVSDIQ